MNTMISFAVVPLFFVFNVYSSVLASHIRFEAVPNIIHPALTKTLKLRCSVDDNNGVTENSLVIGKREATTKTTPLAANSFPISEADASYVNSIIISKLDETTNTYTTIGQVSAYNPANVTLDSDKILVEGDTKSSPLPGEKCYLELTWDHPLRDQSGSYRCEIFTLNSSLRPDRLDVSLEVGTIEPDVDNLVKYIAENDKNIDEMKAQINQLMSAYSQLVEENKNLSRKYDEQVQATNDVIQQLKDFDPNSTVHNIQTGTVLCNNTETSVAVQFPVPFDMIPMVHVSIQTLSFGNFNSYSPFVTPSFVNLSRNGFDLHCNDKYTKSYTVVWLAIDKSTSRDN